MNWVKQNLGLVIGGVVALALLGLAGWFLFQQVGVERVANQKLDSEIDELKRLISRDPHPGTEEVDNIKAVSDEQSRVANLLLDPLEKMFEPYPIPEDLDTFRFKELLEATIADLQRDARSQGVRLPTGGMGGNSNYGFSFDDIRPRPNLAPESLLPLASQLMEVKGICEILFSANIHALNGIKRLEIVEEEEEEETSTSTSTSTTTVVSTVASLSMGEDYIDGEEISDPTTKAVTTPYQISFQAFSSELSEVLTGFNTADHFFKIKWIVVEESDTSVAKDPYGGMSGYGMGGSGMGGEMAARYGMGGMQANPYAGMGGGGRYGGAGGMNPGMASRYGLAPAAGSYNPMGAGGADQGMEDLEEKVLTINAFVDLIKIPLAGTEIIAAPDTTPDPFADTGEAFTGETDASLY